MLRLRSAAATATTEGDLPKARVLWLLGDACALRLDPQRINEPLHSAFEGEEYPFGLSTLSDGDLELLDCVCPEIDDALIQARVADLLWLCRQPRKVHDALRAIDAYRKAPLDGDAWFLQDSRNCWRRAIVLAMQLRKAGEARLLEIEMALLAAINTQLDAGRAGPIADSRPCWKPAWRAPTLLNSRKG